MSVLSKSFRLVHRALPQRTLPAIAKSGMVELGVRRASSQPAYDGHIPLNLFEKGFLAVGSALMSLADPRRGDMVAALGDTTSGPVLPRLRDIMLDSAEGRKILKERPRVNSQTVDMDKLAMLPEGTFGRAALSRFPTDLPGVHVYHRYTTWTTPNLLNVESELALKFFEFANFGLPMTGFAAAFGHLRLNSTQRARLFRDFVPWAVKCGSSARSLITVYWEERWNQNVKEMKEEFGIWDPPEAKWRKPLKEAKEAAARRQKEAEAQLSRQA
ncbi:uncharacterized protein FIBRA_06243 [Fibroporia radiculosa]|uniref:4-hydroxy-3-methoxy-5-polyprenylbenzoate decarboxylase n=1 Tax=Fibroporia radiculosa TaxID=599839 RepID=J4H3Z1_9APHY|nr:uncharacterized protein FIBRA_06243 [Fibroporia radiculosa]CCM04084.1 predicted protein [Fibroporia radiculosa]